LQTDKTLESVKGNTFDEVAPMLAKNYVETKRALGGTVKIPAEGAPEAEQRAFWDRLGVPKDVTGYAEVKLEPIEDMPAIDTAVIDGMVKPAFLKLGFTAKQSQGVLNLFHEYTVSQRRAAADGMMEGQEALRSEWALNFDRNVKIAQSAFHKFMSPSFIEAAKAAQLDMHPDFIKGFYQVGQQLVEDGIIIGDPITVPDKEELTKKITDVRAEIMKTNMGTTRYNELAQQLEALYVTVDGRGPVRTEPQR